MYQIFIKTAVNGKTIVISGNNFNANTTVKELYKLIAAKEGEGAARLRLLFGGKQLDTSEAKSHKKMSDFGIQNGSTLFAVLRLLGGAAVLQPKPVEPEQRDDVKVNDEKVADQGLDLDLNKSQCDICLQNKILVTIHKKNGVKNHKTCAQCMYDQCRVRVWNGKSTITCPISCDYNIPMKTAFTIANLTKNEWKEYELRLNMNALPFKACPNIECGKFIMKDIKQFRLICPSCKKFEFCWSCLGQWKSNSLYECGNNDCNSYATLISEITNSWDARANNEVDGRVGVPKIRICPNSNCQSANQHEKGCKHMTCGKGTKVGCKHEYCHICLKPWVGCKCAYCTVHKQIACKGLGKHCVLYDLQNLK